MKALALRLLLVAAAASAIGVAGGCGSHTSATVLRVDYSRITGHRHATVRCDPPGGDATDPKALCSLLAAQPAVMLPRKLTMICLGPTGAVVVKGIYRGRRVTSTISACTGDGAGLAQWLAYLPPPR